MPETFNIPSVNKLKDTYTKTYKMQTVPTSGNKETVRTSIPREIVEKAARSNGMTITEFVEKFRVSWLYNGFEGAWEKFVPADKE